MAFQPVPYPVDFPAQERELLRFWEETGAFEKLRELRKEGEPWSFIDGPITANNPMGVHHGWGRAYKDLFQRFWAMRGRRLRYQNGFDCQGLWVEVEVEKELGFQTKRQIEEFGLAEFVRRCKGRVLRYAAVQTEQSQRLGYWMDWNDPDSLRRLAEQLLEDPAQQVSLEGPNGPVSGTVEQVIGRLGLPELGGSYFTFSDENNYTIWAFLKKCWQNGWLYRGLDVMPWCPRCATALSQHEIVTEGYAELTHQAVTLKFPLLEREANSFLLVWTTTSWTLSSNVAAAVGPELTYARVRQGEQIFYLAKGALPRLRGPYELLGELRGSEMAGWRYQGPFDDLPAAQRPGGLTPLHAPGENSDGAAATGAASSTTGAVASTPATAAPSAAASHRVILWDEVGESEGTGIVHIAPGCGAEDFELGRREGLPQIAPLDEEGVFLEGFGWLTGMRVAEAAAPIFADLERKGLLYEVAPYSHRYPTCWRCKTELVFRLVDEWFISMGEVYDKPRQELTAEEKAASLRYQIMDVVDQIRWIPAFGYAREMDWLLNMHDWMISKKRFWGLALPVWVCAGCGKFEVIGGQDELRQRTASGWEVFAGHTPHRPYVDAVRLRCPDCAGEMSRIPDVGNPWLDAGVVPFSTLAYRSDPEYWRTWFPAHWISESFPGQFRNWFYSLLAMATVLEGRPPFLQNFSYATLLDEHGAEMHKSSGNAIEFNHAADRMGVDVMRWMFVNQPPENDLLFGYQRAEEARRAFLLPLWNVYSFFVTYANLDGWSPPPAGDPEHPEGMPPASDNPLDRWALARLDETTRQVTQALEDSDPPAAGAALQSLIDDLSNWYVRRSRRRFWKETPGGAGYGGAEQGEKQAAYACLYFALLRLARLLAPITPFVAEAIYQNLVRSVYPESLPSVHHTRWPQPGEAASQGGLLDEMPLLRRLASLGLSARNEAGLKVRQPLAGMTVFLGSDAANPLSPALVEILLDELNVKQLALAASAGELVTSSVLPDNRKLGPRLGTRFPHVRAALAGMDANALAAGRAICVQVDGKTVELAPDELLVETRPAPGLAVASERGLIVAVDTRLTPELRAEGLARELVRRIQALRKQAGLEIADRIRLYYTAGAGQASSAGLAQVMVNFHGYISAETLAVELIPAAPPEGAFVSTQQVEGQEVTFGIVKG